MALSYPFSDFKTCRMIFLLLILSLYFQGTVFADDAADSSTMSNVGEGYELQYAIPPCFTDNSGISMVYDRQSGDWHYFISPYFNLHPQNDRYLGIGQAYADWDKGDFGFSFGRKIITLGPGRYGYPALGPLETGISAEGYDQLGYHFTWGNLKYQKFYALVSESSYRALLGQRTTYDLGPFTFGFSETALANSQAPAYIYLPIPFIPVYFYQYLGDHTGGDVNKKINNAVDFDITWQITDNLKFYVEYYMDDRPWWRWEDGHWVTPEWDRWWWKCGYQGGIQWNNAFNNPALTFYLEYTRIDDYTYTSWHPGEWMPGLDWTDHDRYMGDSLGPDADRWNLELVWRQSPEYQWSFAYQRVRHGEGKIGDHWTYVPGRTVVFLTGTVETTDLLGIGVTRKKGNYDFNITLGLAYINNADHIEGANKVEPKAAVNIKYYLP